MLCLYHTFSKLDGMLTHAELPVEGHRDLLALYRYFGCKDEFEPRHVLTPICKNLQNKIIHIRVRCQGSLREH